MKTEKYIRRMFVRQTGPSDCGLACIRMLLLYSGKAMESPLSDTFDTIPGSGLSLLSLKHIATRQGLKASCVTMDIDFLRRHHSPCILLFSAGENTGHFQLCFGARKKGGRYFYLMADPAKAVYLVPEEILDAQWATKSALYIEDLSFSKRHVRKSQWQILFSTAFFPKVFWISLPLINIFSALFGIALTWVIQKGMNNSLAGQPVFIAGTILGLLLLINLFRALLNFIKLQMLAKVSMATNNRLFDQFMRNNNVANGNAHFQSYSKKTLTDISQVQAGIYLLMSVLISDGALFILTTCAIDFYSLFAMAIIVIFAILAITIAVKKLPLMAYHQANLSELSGLIEISITGLSKLTGEENAPCKTSAMNLVTQNFLSYLNVAKLFNRRVSFQNLIMEWLAALNVMVIFVYCLVQVRQQEISYPSLMFLVFSAYFATILITRICNAFPAISAAAEAYRQLEINQSYQAGH